MAYDGLAPALRMSVVIRDAHSQMAWDRGGRCRWCGRVGPVDVHHIDYRRGDRYDREGNLISLCRPHHNFVHGTPDGKRRTISKRVAQVVLFELLQTPGQTGAALWRIKLRAWAQEGRCQHGDLDCLDCNTKKITEDA
jgi:hypothetical protein